MKRRTSFLQYLTIFAISAVLFLAALIGAQHCFP